MSKINLDRETKCLKVKFKLNCCGISNLDPSNIFWSLQGIPMPPKTHYDHL